MESTELKVTGIDEIKAAAGEQIVELPGFGNGEPFCARLRRLSLLSLAKAGKIPNELLTAVSELYSSGKINNPNLKTTGETMLFIAEQCLAEPTMQQLREAGVELTDMQLTAIYMYSREGIAGLRPFRTEPLLPDAVSYSKGVEYAAQRIARGK